MIGDDDGSASVWVVAAMALLLALTAAVVIRDEAVLARHRAESVADLAALAGAGRIGVGADDGVCATAAGIARSNGARLRWCRPAIGPDGRSGTVSVSVAVQVRLPVVGAREVVASARAGRLPVAAPPPLP